MEDLQLKKATYTRRLTLSNYISNLIFKKKAASRRSRGIYRTEIHEVSLMENSATPM